MKFRVFTILTFTIITFSSWAQIGMDTTQYDKYRFGGYGEVLYQNMDYGADRYNYPDGAQSENRALITVPRAVFSFEYKFSPSIDFNAEVEFEYGGTGSALELEYEEAGEYEMEVEKAGEVILEQLFIRKTFSRAFQVSAGHFIVPVGRLNMYHLPIQYFATVRSEGEAQIIPTTWHESGLAISGAIKKWSYNAMVISGLDANGFSKSQWVGSGYQRLFEDTKATQMAFAFRVNNTSIRNTKVAISSYIGNSAKNTSKAVKMEGINGTVSIFSGDFEFNNRRIITRGNVLFGNLTDSYQIGAINQTLSKNIQYARTPVAKNALTYSIEAGYDVLTHFRSTNKLIPFARYEYYNSMQQTADEVLADERYHRQVFTAGINYFLMPGLALKADYSMRIIHHGDYNQENTLGLSIVYSTFFISK